MTHSELISTLESNPQSMCSCSVCKRMCKVSPCFPTPEEAKRIVDAGYGEQLKFSVWKEDKLFGNGKTWVVVAGGFDEVNGCAFLTPEGLCELHDQGLKPLEGRLAHHSRMDMGMRAAVCRTWYSGAGLKMIQFFEKNFAKDNEDL